MDGDSLPVSAFVKYADGTMPQGAAAYEKRGIATNVHYKPLPMMTAYKNLGFDIKDFPNALAFYENEITLPLYTKLTDEDVEYVTDNYIDILKEYL